MFSDELRLDRRLFSDDVIARTAHRYSSDYYVDLQLDGDAAIVRLVPKDMAAHPESLPERFRNDALDERLREAIRVETGDLQLTLVRAALHESLPRRDETPA